MVGLQLVEAECDIASAGVLDSGGLAWGSEECRCPAGGGRGRSGEVAADLD